VAVCGLFWRYWRLWSLEMAYYLGLYIVWTIVVLVVGTVTLLDWLTRRKDRRSRDRAA
jgi:hypothetical protein